MKKRILLTALIVLAFGCSERKVASSTKKVAENSNIPKANAPKETPPTASPTAATGTSNQEKEYKITSVERDGKHVAFQIVPNAGFKINVDFPWSFKFQNTSVKSGDDKHIKLNPKHADIALELSEATEGQLDGVGSFSVCNDKKCLMYRNEKINIKKQ